MSNTYNIQTRI